MKKEYIIGGLAIVGAIGLVVYLNKPNKNKDGFYSADGGDSGEFRKGRNGAGGGEGRKGLGFWRRIFGA